MGFSCRLTFFKYPNNAKPCSLSATNGILLTFNFRNSNEHFFRANFKLMNIKSTTILKNLALTFLISSFFTFLSLLFYFKMKNGILASELFILSFVGSLFWTLLFCLSALTSLFTLNVAIHKDKLKRIISFYLLPTLVAIYLLLESGNGGDTIPILITSLIFLAIHSWFYLRMQSINGQK